MTAKCKDWFATLEICVESTADVRYTATKDAQGKLRNLQSNALSPFSSRRPSDDMVGHSLSDPHHVVASARARSYRCRAATIESFRRSPEAFFYLGPFQEELIGSAGVQYTDNVNLAATNKISDLSFTQALNLNTTWVISHLNQLQFNFGGQLIENFYGNGRNQVNFAIAPDSMIEFKFAISDLQVRLYDQFSYVQNPTSDPTRTNTANLNSLTNTIGAVVDTDLNIAVLSFSADYTYNNQSGTNAQSVRTRANQTTIPGHSSLSASVPLLPSG